MKKQPLRAKITEFILVFIISIYLFPALKDFIYSIADFPLKNLFLIIIPSPEDSLLQLIQFISYWIGAGYLTFRNRC